MLAITLFLIGGLAALLVGAEFLVKGASNLSLRLGLSALVVGLTVVAFGTSAPELAISLFSVLEGKTDIAVGNVVGSNIFNVLFILGLSAAVAPLVVKSQLIRFDVPILIGVSLLTWLLARDGQFDRVEGAVLFAGAIFYTTFLIWQSRRETKEIVEEYKEELEQAPYSSKKPTPQLTAQLLFIAAGLGLLVFGSRLFVSGAVDLAKMMGVSDLVIGLTIVAAGTSLPEVATSVLASARGHTDIAVGNVIGSNIFNLFSVLGLTSLVAPSGLPVSPGTISVDLPVMLGVAMICLPVLHTGLRVSRLEGVLLFGLYLAYTAWLVLNQG